MPLPSAFVVHDRGCWWTPYCSTRGCQPEVFDDDNPDDPDYEHDVHDDDVDSDDDDVDSDDDDNDDEDDDDDDVNDDDDDDDDSHRSCQPLAGADVNCSSFTCRTLDCPPEHGDDDDDLKECCGTVMVI